MMAMANSEVLMVNMVSWSPAMAEEMLGRQFELPGKYLLRLQFKMTSLETAQAEKSMMTEYAFPGRKVTCLGTLNPPIA